MFKLKFITFENKKKIIVFTLILFVNLKFFFKSPAIFKPKQFNFLKFNKTNNKLFKQLYN